MVRKALFSCGLKKSFHTHVPILVVGNIGIGGNGKTPFVLWLVDYLQSRGVRVAVISRGYGAKALAFPYEVSSLSTVTEAGDEPYLLYSRLKCPVVIGADRQASCEYLHNKYTVDLIISDDGLQHYKMPRSVEFCIIDSVRRFGNGCLLPAGPLRELPSRLKKVDMVVENGGHGGIDYALINTGIYQVKSGKKCHEFPGKGIAVSAIGNPQRFEHSLTDFGIKISKHVHFRDHHAFQAEDFNGFEHEAVFMTEKDAVKCQSFALDNWYYLRVDAKPSELLVMRLQEILKTKEIYHGVR